jgi:hypothetical protein
MTDLENASLLQEVVLQAINAGDELPYTELSTLSEAFLVLSHAWALVECSTWGIEREDTRNNLLDAAKRIRQVQGVVLNQLNASAA